MTINEIIEQLKNKGINPPEDIVRKDEIIEFMLSEIDKAKPDKEEIDKEEVDKPKPVLKNIAELCEAIGALQARYQQVSDNDTAVYLRRLIFTLRNSNVANK